MKKKILSFIFIIICLPVLVFAKDKPFYKKFQTSDVNNYFETSFLSKTIELKNNYYTLSEIKELTSTSNIFLLKSMILKAI